LGAFLATINIFKMLGRSLADVYSEFMEIQQSVGPLKRITELMNMETDVQLRMKVNESWRTQGEEFRQAARRSSQRAVEGSVTGFPVDLVPISLSKLSFKYPNKPPILQNVDIMFEQGKMHAFVGPPHEGKATFLRLIGQVLIPQSTADFNSGTVFIPPHLRVLHLSQEAFFLHGTMLQNLIFNTSMTKVGGLSRIKKICEVLQFPEAMMAHLNEPDRENSAASGGSTDDDVFSWLGTLSHSDYPRVNLARALIMNPECLVLHKPFLVFGDEEGHLIVAAIRKHVDEKGLELSVEQRKFRRPRTVFFSSSSQQGLEESDFVYHVGIEVGVKQITKSEAVEEVSQFQSVHHYESQFAVTNVQAERTIS